VSAVVWSNALELTGTLTAWAVTGREAYIVSVSKLMNSAMKNEQCGI
jgi:hypothetical protein